MFGAGSAGVSAAMRVSFDLSGANGSPVEVVPEWFGACSGFVLTYSNKKSYIEKPPWPLHRIAAVVLPIILELEAIITAHLKYRKFRTNQNATGNM